jgi:hypothetical protein
MKCKKLTYRNLEKNKPHNVLLGIVIGEDDHIIFFRTGNRRITVSKSLILSLEDTNEEFRGKVNSICSRSRDSSKQALLDEELDFDSWREAYEQEEKK